MSRCDERRAGSLLAPMCAHSHVGGAAHDLASQIDALESHLYIETGSRTELEHLDPHRSFDTAMIGRDRCGGVRVGRRRAICI